MVLGRGHWSFCKSMALARFIIPALGRKYSGQACTVHVHYLHQEPFSLQAFISFGAFELFKLSRPVPQIMPKE